MEQLIHIAKLNMFGETIGSNILMKDDDDNDITMESSTESLSQGYQATNKYNNLLPYSEILDKEATTFLTKIKGQLGRSVMLRRLEPDCLIHIMKLRNYIKLYSLRFSKDDHILFIKLMYELLTIPDLEPDVINSFGSFLISLLRKKDLIEPSELELPWRPLYELKTRSIDMARNHNCMYRFPSRVAKTIDTLIDAGKLYFPLTATREILDELRPMICPLDTHTTSRAMDMLELFLPYQLFPEDAEVGYKLWFDEFMKLWEVCNNAPAWEHSIMSLMSRLAWHNIGYIDWEPYIPIMTTRFMRCLNLPVFYKNTKISKNHKITTNSVAYWVVAVLGNGSSGQFHLEKFLKTIETYLHQANTGPWIDRLKDFLSKLTNHFVSRLHFERFRKKTWQPRTPDSHKLTDEDVDAFVKCMMPVAMTAMFGHSSVIATSKVFRLLATIRPNLVIPDVLERMYSTLDSLTEPHKLTATMSAVTAVARPLVQGRRNVNTGYTYNEGPSRVMSLLFSSLPGIDGNDFIKCFATFRLISVYAAMVPIVDCSRAAGSPLLDEDDRIACEETSQFEDFIIQFFDRIFTLIESSTLEYVSQENQESAGRSRVESMVELTLGSVSSILLLRASDNIFLAALHKLKIFVTEKVLETRISGPLAASLCRSFARVNGKETLRLLLPTLLETIFEICEESDVTKEEHLDNSLLYSLLLVSNVVCTGGDYLLPYKETLIELLDKVLHLKSREGNQIASRILKNILRSLATVASRCDFKYDGRNYNDPDYPYLLDWGQGIDFNSFELDWYVPGDEEIGMLQSYFTRFLSVEVEKIEEFCRTGNSITRPELLTSLNIILTILEGSINFLPIPEENINPEDSFLPFIGITGEIKMPDGSNVRSFMLKLITKLQSTMLENSEDDTKSLSVLPRIWGILLLGKKRHMANHKRHMTSWNHVKYELRDDLVKKRRHLAECLLERTDLQHEMRVYSQHVGFSDFHKHIMLQLFKLSTSTYAHVRMTSQDVLSSAIPVHLLCRNIFMQDILEVLSKDPEEFHNAHKGLLYLLAGPRLSALVISRDWNFLKIVWPALVLSKPSEKMSVIRLRNTLTETISIFMPTLSIKVVIPDKCVEAAKQLWKTSPIPEIKQPQEMEIEEGRKELEERVIKNEKDYDELLDAIVDGIQENCHWRQASMGMRLLRDLAHPQRNYSIKVVNFFLNALIHDSLQERKIATLTVTCILQQLKRQHPKIKIESPILPPTDSIWANESTLPGVRSDNTWLQYNSEKRPMTAAQWDEPRFVHKQHLGYYTWPKEIEIYAPSSEQPTLDPSKRILTESEKLVDQFFAEPQNIDKLIKFNSIEERKGKDKFSNFRFLFYKGLFRNHGIAHLENFLPHLVTLVVDKQESHQLCAAEIIAGIIRGSKHWPFEMVSEMWEFLLPVIREALDNINTETTRDWGLCFGTAMSKRDPNRHHWLLECLMEEPTSSNSTASLHECERLHIVQLALMQQTWRSVELMNRLLVRVESRLIANPFQNVRDCLGSLLTLIYAAEYDTGIGGIKIEKKIPRAQDLLDKYFPQLMKLADDESSLELDGKKESVNLLKALCKWLITNAFASEHGSLPGFSLLLPVLCQLENYEPDDELRMTCKRALATMAQALRLPRDMDSMLDALHKVSNVSSWSARSSCLSFIEVFVFYNMGVILNSEIWIGKIQEIVLRLLADDRVEVRDKAGTVLCGLLHCAFLPDQKALLTEFKRKSKMKIKNADDLRVRHAGVLGLCAFVRAHPYDLPKYVPSIFEYLSLRLNDPQPIPTTIRKTLGDFKRTHYDGWANHALCFTEEQLGILQDLTVPPSYYA